MKLVDFIPIIVAIGCMSSCVLSIDDCDEYGRPYENSNVHRPLPEEYKPFSTIERSSVASESGIRITTTNDCIDANDGRSQSAASNSNYYKITISSSCYLTQKIEVGSNVKSFDITVDPECIVNIDDGRKINSGEVVGTNSGGSTNSHPTITVINSGSNNRGGSVSTGHVAHGTRSDLNQQRPAGNVNSRFQGYSSTTVVHGYDAHAAFKTGNPESFILNSGSNNQGGNFNDKNVEIRDNFGGLGK